MLIVVMKVLNSEALVLLNMSVSLANTNNVTIMVYKVVLHLTTTVPSVLFE